FSPAMEGREMIPSPEDHREFLGSIIAARTNDEARKIRDDFNHRFPTFSESEVWEEPLPLTAKVEPEPYPVDALPEIVRAAVEEVQAFSKAPISLVASSALGALSLAAQALFDVKRAEKLSGPVGLFLLTIADSGERKSTCDTFFLKAIREFQKEQVETAKPKLAKYRAELAAWEAKRDGFLDAIRKDSRQDKETETKEKALHELEIEKPTPPRIPQLLRGDETPENLAWALANEWPSAGIMSSEAGAILGAHGMGKDSIMRNLALYNILWDGGSLSIGRRSSESFTVQGARLSVGLQVQEATLRSFFDRSGGLARGTGFLARFLLAWPESTQGYRHFSEAPADWPKLAAFNRRISEILNQPVAIDEESLLSLSALSLTVEAKSHWISFHDAIESELRSGGELYDVRDVASKAADNAARLAALFQILEQERNHFVGKEALEGACRIVAWHLNEARRFFGEFAIPEEMLKVAHLDAWLIEYCRRKKTNVIPRREIQRCGPN
ncbi:MAG TPA: hypothetical protein DF383_02825, partial [Deltaproteobacteria bacterium]|nr:hypothetical protein [Deltaproteobacteria bacterium]